MVGGRNAGGGRGGGGGGGRDRLMPSRIAWRIFSTLDTSSSYRELMLVAAKPLNAENLNERQENLRNQCFSLCFQLLQFNILRHKTRNAHQPGRTWPSHMSSRADRSLAARASLLWNSLPSKKPQGQQCSHGNGWPQTSFMNNAVSTPAIKREASCTPRASTFST